MNGLLILALVCRVGLAPADCTPALALDVIVRPASVAVPTACLLEGEALLASGALGSELAPGTYRKVRCAPRRR